MSRPEWLPLIEAQLAAAPTSNVYALATVENGAPKVRHVVHRGFSPSGTLLATTDRRMPKASQLAASPAASVAWYFPGAMVQVRVEGTARTIGTATEAASETSGPSGSDTATATAAAAEGPQFWADTLAHLWDEGMSPYLKASFARPATPGTLLADAPPVDGWPTELGRRGQGEPSAEEAKQLEFARSNFCVLALTPERVEVLELKCSPHRRTAWRRVREDGGWDKGELVP